MESLFKPFTISLPPRLQTCRIGWWPTRRPMERPITPSTTVQLAIRHRLLIFFAICRPFKDSLPLPQALPSKSIKARVMKIKIRRHLTHRKWPDCQTRTDSNLKIWQKKQWLLILETLKREKGICAGAHCGLTFPGTKSICGTNLEAWIELAWITNMNLRPCLHADWTGLKKTEKRLRWELYILFEISV